MNLGAFTVVLAVARKTRSGEIDSYGGLLQYAPGLAVAMTVFLAALAGIPPAGGWFAKFGLFRALLDAGGSWAAALGVIVAINTVIAFAYYARVLVQMWFQSTPDGDERPIVVTGSLRAALAVTIVATMAFGVLPGLVGHFGEVSVLSALGG